jgi:hypothetical protein
VRTIEPHGAGDDWPYCGLCQRWTASMVLESTKVPDPLDPGRKIDLLLCATCRERTP